MPRRKQPARRRGIISVGASVEDLLGEIVRLAGGDPAQVQVTDVYDREDDGDYVQWNLEVEGPSDLLDAIEAEQAPE